MLTWIIKFGLLVAAATLRCRWPVPIPGGYLVGCDVSEALDESQVNSCSISCDTSSWHFGSASLACDNVTGILSLSGCQSPSCPAQCSAYTALGTVSGSISALTVDHKDGSRLLAVDSTNHVVLSLRGLGASFTTEVLWGSTGASGDADGPALSSRLFEPSGLVLTASSAERLVFVADSGNGKALVVLLRPRFTKSFVRDAIRYTNMVGLAHEHGALGVYRMTLTGARIQVLSSGTWSNPSSDLLPQPRGLGAVTPGPLTMDETVGVANAVLVDVAASVNRCPLGRSCAELGWDSAYHGSSQVCGRSEGNASVLGARCNYTYNLGVCCSGRGILNFADAESFCLQQGARLCTQEELFDNEASDSPLYSDCITGSSWVYDGPYDRANIWSSSPCTIPSTGLPGFMTRSGTRSWGNWAPDDCRPSSELAFVKCCADRDLMFPMAGFQPPSAISGEVSQHGLFHTFANTITAVAMDAGKRVLFVAAGSDVVQLSLGAQRFVAAGQIGNEDSASKGCNWKACWHRLE
eukprot:symbB.v1.2.011448.t1/scaffold762.1/size178242/9